MGAAERIAELTKGMEEREQKDAFAVFEKHAGLWSGKFNRDDAYADRKVLR